MAILRGLPPSVASRQAVVSILAGLLDGKAPSTKASGVLTSVACRLQLVVFELERLGRADGQDEVAGMLTRLGRHVGLLQQASRTPGVQSGYALLTELGELLQDLEAAIVRLPGALGDDAACRPVLDELQLLLSRVATYRAECDDTRSSLEEALLELVPHAHAPLTHGAAAVAVASGEAPAPTPAAGDGPVRSRRQPQQLSGPPSAGPFGSQGFGSLQQQQLQAAPPAGSNPHHQQHFQPAQQQQQQQLSDARLARVRRAVRLLQRDMDVAGGEDQDLEAELLLMRAQLQHAAVAVRQHTDTQRQLQQQVGKDKVQEDSPLAQAWAEDTDVGCGAGGGSNDILGNSSNDGLGGVGGGAGGPPALRALRRASRRLARQHLARLKAEQEQREKEQQEKEQREERARQERDQRPRAEADKAERDQGGDPGRMDAQRLNGGSAGQSLSRDLSSAMGAGRAGESASDATVGTHGATSGKSSGSGSSTSGAVGAAAPSEDASGDPTADATAADSSSGLEAAVSAACCAALAPGPGPSPPPSPTQHMRAIAAAAAAAARRRLTRVVQMAMAMEEGRQPGHMEGEEGEGEEAGFHVGLGMPELAAPPPGAPPGGGVSPFLLLALEQMKAKPPPVLTRLAQQGTGEEVQGQQGTAAAMTSPRAAAAVSPTAAAAAAGLHRQPGLQRQRDAAAAAAAAGCGGPAPLPLPLPDASVHLRAVGLPPSARDPALHPAAAASPFHQQYTHLHSPLPAAQHGRQLQRNTPDQGPCPAQEVPQGQEQEHEEQPHPPAPRQQPPQPDRNAPTAQLATRLATAATAATLAAGPADPWVHMPAWWRPAGGGGASSGGGLCGGDGPDGEAGRALAAMAFSPDVPLLDWGRDIGALGACLGRGAYGCVYRAQFRGTAVAVKVLRGDELEPRMLRSLGTEVSLLCSPALRSHPHVIACHGCALCPGPPPRLALVTELMDCDLYDYIHRRRQNDVPLGEVLHIARAIASGLAQLHPRIVHRDLKPSNVLVRHTPSTAAAAAAANGGSSPTAAAAAATDPWRAVPGGGGGGGPHQRLVVKIADFGLARHKRSAYLSTRERDAGTAYYMAPECIAGGGEGEGAEEGRISEKCDVYSFGVLLYELLTGREPWKGCHPMYVMYEVTRGSQLPLPDDPSRCPAPLAALLRACWARQPQARPSAAELVAALDGMAADMG